MSKWGLAKNIRNGAFQIQSSFSFLFTIPCNHKPSRKLEAKDEANIENTNLCRKYLIFDNVRKRKMMP